MQKRALWLGGGTPVKAANQVFVRRYIIDEVGRYFTPMTWLKKKEEDILKSRAK